MSGSKDIDRQFFAFSNPLILPNPISASALFLSLALLGGCAETTAAIPPAAGADHRFVFREDANVAAVKLAVMSLSGMPEEFAGRFKAVFDAETRKLQLDFVSEKPDYFLRGYLTAYPSEDGTAVAVVWDVFDAHKKRVQRLADQMFMPKSADPGSWTSLEAEDWGKFARLSAANLAAFVSNAPESHNKEKPGLPNTAPSPNVNTEIANFKDENSLTMNEGRTIAVKTPGEAASPDAKIASFH